MRQQPVQSGHAHIVEPGHAASERLGRARGLLGHGHIAGSAGRDGDIARQIFPFRRGNAGLRQGIIIERHVLRHALCLVRAHSRNQYVFRARSHQMRANAGDLLGRFASTVNHLARALPHRAVVIDHCIAQILKRLGL